jgi:hypothetical protein
MIFTASIVVVRHMFATPRGHLDRSGCHDHVLGGRALVRVVGPRGLLAPTLVLRRLIVG